MKKYLKKFIFIITRLYWTSRAKSKVNGTKKRIYVNHKSYFTKNTFLGENVHFNGIRITGPGKVYIGSNFHSGSGIIILTSNHNYSSLKSIPYDNTYIIKDVTIQDNVWLGINVTILPGVTIGEGAIIQAGSVVVSNIPPLAIAGGHPAKVFSYRDEKTYWSLKEQGKFH